MTIRLRLLIILLVTALTPLVLTSLTHQISIRIAKHHLATTTRAHLDANARLALQELHQSHVALLQKDRQLTEALLASQAREIENALSTCSTADTIELESNNSFGYDPNITVPLASYHPYFQDTNDPNITKLNIDYQRQAYTVFSPVADPNQTKSILSSMASLTHTLYELYEQAPKGLLWMSTNLLSKGINIRYPYSEDNRRLINSPMGDNPIRNNFMRDNPMRGRSNNPNPMFSRNPNRPNPWNGNREGPAPGPQGFRRGGRPQRPLIPTSLDPITHQWVMINSTNITSSDGTITGTTEVARTIPEVFKDLALPERWGHETEHMLIRVDPNAPTQTQVEKILHDKQTQVDRSSWRRSSRWGGRGGFRISPTSLTSQDKQAFQAMMADLLAGKPGTQIMEYNGNPCLWAYQPLDISQVAAILIVPYDKVTELASTMEKSLIKESLFWLQITTVVLVLATGLAIVLAVIKARSLTQPITSLIHAGRQLAAGDYEAQVQVTADDELGQLGKVFNDIGPKLRERETMKQSLQLAGVVQKSLLPKQIPNLKHFDIAGHCLYCEETGGDYYDFIDLADVHSNKFSVVLGDVSGHGIGAALLMASVRGIMHSEIKHSAADLVKLLDSLNQQVIEDTEADKFVTLFHGILDDRNRSFIWASAGHEPAYWYHTRESHFEELPNTGMPIGILPDAVFDQAGPISPESGDLIIIGTDGIWEARNEHNAFFGKERFYKTIQAHAQETAQQLCAAVIDEVAAFIGPADRTDDITLIIIKAA